TRQAHNLDGHPLHAAGGPPRRPHRDDAPRPGASRFAGSGACPRPARGLAKTLRRSPPPRATRPYRRGNAATKLRLRPKTRWRSREMSGMVAGVVEDAKDDYGVTLDPVKKL